MSSTLYVDGQSRTISSVLPDTTNKIVVPVPLPDGTPMLSFGKLIATYNQLIPAEDGPSLLDSLIFQIIIGS